MNIWTNLPKWNQIWNYAYFIILNMHLQVWNMFLRDYKVASQGTFIELIVILCFFWYQKSIIWYHNIKMIFGYQKTISWYQVFDFFFIWKNYLLFIISTNRFVWFHKIIFYIEFEFLKSKNNLMMSENFLISRIVFWYKIVLMSIIRITDIIFLYQKIPHKY